MKMQLRTIGPGLPLLGLLMTPASRWEVSLPTTQAGMPAAASLRRAAFDFGRKTEWNSTFPRFYIWIISKLICDTMERGCGPLFNPGVFCQADADDRFVGVSLACRFDREGNPLEIVWFPTDLSAKPDYYFPWESLVEIAPGETDDTPGGWSLNDGGLDTEAPDGYHPLVQELHDFS